MRTEGLPSLDAALLPRIQRYSRVAGHSLVGWHPQRAELLLSHLVQGLPQLGRVVAPLAPFEPITRGNEPVRSAVWDRSAGQQLVFSRSTGGDEAYQLFHWVMDPGGKPQGEPIRLTDPQQRHSLWAWSRPGAGQPQGDKRPHVLVASLPLDRSVHASSSVPVDAVHTTLRWLDPAQPGAFDQAPILTRLPGGGWFGARLSPDGSTVGVTRYTSAERSDIWAIDARSGERRRLWPLQGLTGATAPARSHHLVGWAPDGHSAFVLSDAHGEFNELLLVHPASGHSRRLSAHIPWNVEQAELSADGRTLALRVNVDGRGELRLMDTGTYRERALPSTAPAGSVTHIDAHPKLPLVAFSLSSAQGPSQVHVLNIEDGRYATWTEPVIPPTLNTRTFQEPQVVRWGSFDGRAISGILHHPPASFTGRRPVLMVMHGGPESQARLGWAGRLNFLVQELGIAVLEPNVRGSSGYGRTFLSLDNGRLREDSVKDMAAALDWIATQPGLDAQRVVISGGSYGGYMALAASVHLGERIRGAVSVVGISHFVSFLERTESYRRDLRRVEYGDERDPAMREHLHRISPLTQAQRITQPLLVAQGRNDPRVPWTESEQIVRNLQARKAPVWYLLADNEGHGFARRENADYYYAALVTFLQWRLLGP